MLFLRLANGIPFTADMFAIFQQHLGLCSSSHLTKKKDGDDRQVEPVQDHPPQSRSFSANPNSNVSNSPPALSIDRNHAETAICSHFHCSIARSKAMVAPKPFENTIELNIPNWSAARSIELIQDSTACALRHEAAMEAVAPGFPICQQPMDSAYAEYHLPYSPSFST
jgi:hypothetical protein